MVYKCHYDAKLTKYFFLQERLAKRVEKAKLEENYNPRSSSNSGQFSYFYNVAECPQSLVYLCIASCFKNWISLLGHPVSLRLYQKQNIREAAKISPTSGPTNH